MAASRLGCEDPVGIERAIEFSAILSPPEELRTALANQH